MKLLASCAFGLEAIVARELKGLGYETQIVSPGQIAFDGEWPDIAKANLWLRTADRIQIIVAEFPCEDFDQLFETTKVLEWNEWICNDGFIHVTGSSVQSQLTSVPAVQRATKKAIVERLLQSSALGTLPETGPRYRVHVGLRNNVARLTLDTTGASLHKRGYREIATRAPLKETLAAAFVQLSFWKPGKPLIDPFCGGGTILIEAAMIGRNIAPGHAREFESEAWPSFPKAAWEAERTSAKEGVREPLELRLIGRDIHGGALSLARRNSEVAGVADDVHFEKGDFVDLTSKKQYGVIITNPPYGDRIQPSELRAIYESIPGVLGRLPTWSHYIFTSYSQFETLIGKQADRRRKLYNGRIECTYYQYHGPKPNQRVTEDSEPDTTPAFGASVVDFSEQQEIFGNRLRKRARHLRRWPKKGITCYRLYERDIPEIPLVVDRYEDCLHIVEFERPHDRDLASHQLWLDAMSKTAGATLEAKKVFVKSRLRQRGADQHEKLSDKSEEKVVHEGGLKFLVNLSDYTDTGLFLDHRNARSMIREMSSGKRVLNLFAYTGSFSVYAADGGASHVTTVDLSNTYLHWAKRNFELNQIRGGTEYRFERADAREFIRTLPTKYKFDLIVCDPPTFSNSKRTDDNWDVQRHHPELISDMIDHLNPDGTILFSSNFRRLKLDEENMKFADVREITKKTLPEEYRNRRIHRSWFIKHRVS